MSAPAEIYQQRLITLKEGLALLIQKRRQLGLGRFVLFVLTIALSYKIFTAFGLYGLLPVVIGFSFLLFLVSLDVANNQKITHTQTLIRINEEELEILQHRYHQREDGHSFTPASHAYANDLDLFGKASLFQWANRCYTEQGQSLFARNLLEPLDITTIQQRHEAIRELTGDLAWRQALQATALQTRITHRTEARTHQWLAEENRHFTNKAWKAVVIIYSCITLGSALAAIFNLIPASLFSGLYGFYFFTSIILSRNTIKPYIHLSGIVKEVNTLHQLMERIESRNFQAPLLQELQKKVRPGASSASSQIKHLKTILDRFDLRLNIAGLLFFNAFLLWDVRQMIALNEWRNRNRSLSSRWFSTIAEMEVLHSLSNLRFNQPKWVFPVFSNAHFTLHCKGLGHPLIPEGVRVLNDFSLERTPKIGLITGSNMAGKSTFLRSLGVNILLAQMGAPVCASLLELSSMHLMSSMRISDNLAENTSTFYAELKKLKTIIEAVNRKETVFILLDEILRGTNSLDRHTGSEALVRQLIREQAVAVIATHDVELAALEAQYPSAIDNYHFDVQVAGEELYFDYRLKKGVCTSLNASLLMKKIGIEL